ELVLDGPELFVLGDIDGPFDQLPHGLLDLGRELFNQAFEAAVTGVPARRWDGGRWHTRFLEAGGGGRVPHHDLDLRSGRQFPTEVPAAPPTPPRRQVFGLQSGCPRR